MDFSIAYSASVGGLCTIIGNPPNLILNEFMNQQYGVKQLPQDVFPTFVVLYLVHVQICMLTDMNILIGGATT